MRWLPFAAFAAGFLVVLVPGRVFTFWLPHVLGIDTQQSWFYDFWSGFAASGAAWVAILLAWRSMRIELQALRLEAELMRLELAQQHRDEDARPDDGSGRASSLS